MALEIFLMRMHLALPFAKVGAEHRAPFVDYLDFMHSLSLVGKERGAGPFHNLLIKTKSIISEMQTACLAKLGFFSFYQSIDAPILFREIEPYLNKDKQCVYITLWLMGWTGSEQIRTIAQSALRSAHEEGVAGYVDEYRGPAKMMRPQICPELSDFSKTGYSLASGASDWSLDSDLREDPPPE